MADGTPGGGAVEHFDVLIVGAGLSGIGAGWHLQDKAPDRDPAAGGGLGPMGVLPGEKYSAS